jgi:DNA transformation protein
MAVTNSFQTFVLEQLNRAVPPVRSRRMFGGVGIYSGDLFFALIDDDAVYLKTDDETKQAFEARGMGPFRPMGEDGETMRYHQLPEDVLENPESLRVWAERAIGVARQARARPASKRGGGKGRR